MEASPGKKGFIKRKLAQAKSLYRATGKANWRQQKDNGVGGSKVRPTPSLSVPAQNNYVYKATENIGGSFQDTLYWGSGGDENVDAKAASYISNVRERFKLERLDSNGGYNYKHQESL